MADPENFLGRLDNLYIATTRNFSFSKYYYSELIYSLLTNLSLQVSKVSMYSTCQENQIISLIMNYLEENYFNNISLYDISEALGKTPEYLCNIFKSSLHSTIIEELTNIRISHARIMLLEYPNISVAEIGARCGFQSPSYFGKVFKKKCGLTPNAYRIHCN